MHDRARNGPGLLGLGAMSDMWETTQGFRRQEPIRARMFCTLGTRIFCNMATSRSGLLLAMASPTPTVHSSSMYRGHSVPRTKPLPPALK